MNDARFQHRSTTPADPLPVVLAIVTAVQLLATFTVLALPSVAPRAVETIGVGPQVVGYQISIIYLTAALLSSIAGLIARRLGAALTSILAMLLGGLGLVMIALGTLAAAIAGSVVLGIGYGITNPAASHVLLRFADRGHRNLIFAIKQAGVPAGGMLASFMLPHLSERVGWQWAIALSALLFLAMCLPLLTRRRRWDDDRIPGLALRGGLAASVSLIAQVPALRALAIMGFCYAGFQFALLAFAVTMLVNDLGWSLVAAGTIAMLMQLGGVLGRLFWSVIADRLAGGLHVLSAIGLLSTVFSLAVSMITPGWPAVLLVLLLASFAFCIVGWNGVYMAEVARATGPTNVGVATGGVLIFNFLGVVTWPAVVATVYGSVGSLVATLGMFCFVPLIGALATISAIRAERRAVKDQSQT